MDRRRAAGALLALAVCVASSDAAPTASNQTALDLYDGAAEGCYYNFQHYGEGDRIMTNEPCLNCTCHNRMLMCYLRVCPFTKPIGQDCTVEKRADQCCPIVTCPDVPVDLLTSTSTTSPAEYGATGIGKLDKYGCSINGKYFPEGSKVPPTPNKPCEHCYCIRNMTTCVMQECTLHVDGCTPIYHKDVCCPVRYSCDHPEDEMLLLDDMTTTVRPTPGFLLTTTTLSPVTQMSQDCIHEDRIVPDGALIKTEKACEHCYCMKGDIVCVVQECGTPMENEGKNCTSQQPREGQCCPDTYICDGDEITTDLPSEITSEPIVSEELTTLSPPRRVGVEGSGYRKETDEPYTEVTSFEMDTEGSGYDNEIIPHTETSDKDTTEKQIPEVTNETTEDNIYITSTAKSTVAEETDKTTEPDKGLNTVPSGLIDEETSVTPTPQRTTTSEEAKLTELSTISEDEKVDFESKTVNPEITEKHDEILTTTESLFRNESESNEVTEMFEHTEAEHTYSLPPEQTTPILDHVTSEAETEAQSVDEKEVMLTTNLFTTTYEPSDEKETSTPLSIEKTTSAEKIKPPSDTTSSVTVEYNEITTQAFTEITSSEDIAKPDISTEVDIAKQSHVTTESLSDFGMSSSEPYDDDTKKETEATTQDFMKLSTFTEATQTIDEVSSDIATEEKKTTTESILKLSTQTEYTKPSEDGFVDKTTEEKEDATGSSLETSSSTDGTMLPDKFSKDSTVQEKEATTESLETSSSAATTKTLDEMGSEAIADDKDVTTETLLQPSTSGIEIKPTESSDSTSQETTTEPSLETSSYEITTETFHKISDEVTSEEKEVTTESLLQPVTHKKVFEPSEISTTSITDMLEETLSTTEKTKVPETTIIDNQENEVEDFARIPGEGDCLVNSITYGNNSDVPSTNNCHTGCRCISSIVKCDPIICSPPPEYMDNCQPTYDTPDSCCPTYICHSGETMPPQPDSHMSGTEKPVTSSILECHGDECIVKQKVESPASSTKPVVSECGSASCGDVVHAHPNVTSPDKISDVCIGNECSTSTKVCADGECEESLPQQPCEGENCVIEPVIVPVKNIPLCQNENDCKAQPIPCEGNACVHVDCNTPDCSTDAIVQPIEKKPKPEICTAENTDCQKQEVDIKLPCIGDSCRRIDTKEQENQLPVGCSDSDCETQKQGVMSNEDVQTEIPSKEKVTETVTETTQEETATETTQEETATETTQEETATETTQEETSTKSHHHIEESSVTKGYEQSTSTTTKEVSAMDVTTTAEILESSVITVEPYLTTESPDVKIIYTKPTPQSEDITSTMNLSITESQLPEKTTPSKEEQEAKPTVVYPEISEQTSKLPEDESSTKPFEVPITTSEETATDKPIVTQSLEGFEATTQSQESSVTGSQEITTKSSLPQTEKTEEDKQDTSTESLNMTDIFQPTTSVAITVQEKESATSSTIQQSDESTTVKATDEQRQTPINTDKPSDDDFVSKLPHDVVDMTTPESAHKIKDEKPEFEDVTDITATVSAEITETESGIITTEATKEAQSTIQTDVEPTSESNLSDILNTTPTKEEEKDTEAPFTSKPLMTSEGITTVPDIMVTEENIITMMPDILLTEKEIDSKPSEEPVTMYDLTSTLSEEVTAQKQDSTEPSTDLLVTEVTQKDTDKYTTRSEDASYKPTESSPTEKDKQTDYSEVPTAEPTVPIAEDDSSTQKLLFTDFIDESSKTPEQDQVTDSPLEITSAHEPEKEETTEKGLITDIPVKSTSLVDDAFTKKPDSEAPEVEATVTETSTKLVETTKPEPSSVSEDDSQTEELSYVTDKMKDDDFIRVTGTPNVIDQQEILTTAKMPEELSTTAFAPTTTQKGIEINQLDSQTTTSEEGKKEEPSTQEPQNLDIITTSADLFTSSSEASITDELPSKTSIGYPVTESELLTDVSDQIVTEKDKEMNTPENLFTVEDSELMHTTKLDVDSTKMYTKKDDSVTEIPVLTTKQEEESETTDISDLKTHDHETQEPDTTTASSIESEIDKAATQPDVEITTKSVETLVTESTIPLSTNIQETHKKDDEESSLTTIATFADVTTSIIQEEPTQTPYQTVSELQTEKLLEVTIKPQDVITKEPQEITTLSLPGVTQDIHKDVTTKEILEVTTESILDMSSVLPHDKEITDVETVEPGVEVTTKFIKETTLESQTETEADIKESSTESLYESSTDTMIDDEKTTPKYNEPVTEDLQDTVTKTMQATAEDETKETQLLIDQTTESVISGEENIVSEEPEIPTTPAPQEKSTEVEHETSPEVQLSITTTMPESSDSKYEETSEGSPESSSTTSLPEEMVTAHVKINETSTKLPDQEITKTEIKETSETKYDITETTPYVVELEEHTHKIIEEASTLSVDEESITKPTESHLEISTEKETTPELEESSQPEKEQFSSSLPSADESQKPYDKSELSTPSLLPTEELALQTTTSTTETPVKKPDYVPPKDSVPSTSKPESTVDEIEIPVQTEKTSMPDELTTFKEEKPVTSPTTKIEEDITTLSSVNKQETKPAETLPPTTIPETPKPGLNEILPTDEIPDDDGHFPPSGGYGQEPDYVEEDQAFGPGTCRYGGKVYVSAQQIPRDDPCDFCFCFRSDIICLQQSCPPPIHGCHEEPIQGFCCPRYECPVAMATSVNVTTTTTTTTTTLPPHFLPHAYKGAAQRRGCQIKGHTYKVGEVVRASSGPCLHCTCGGDGQMKCDPKACTPEPMLRQMIAAAVSAKRRR